MVSAALHFSTSASSPSSSADSLPGGLSVCFGLKSVVTRVEATKDKSTKKATMALMLTLCCANSVRPSDWAVPGKQLEPRNINIKWILSAVVSPYFALAAKRNHPQGQLNLWKAKKERKKDWDAAVRTHHWKVCHTHAIWHLFILPDRTTTCLMSVSCLASNQLADGSVVLATVVLRAEMVHRLRLMVLMCWVPKRQTLN